MKIEVKAREGQEGWKDGRMEGDLLEAL